MTSYYDFRNSVYPVNNDHHTEANFHFRGPRLF